MIERFHMCAKFWHKIVVLLAKIFIFCIFKIWNRKILFPKTTPWTNHFLANLESMLSLSWFLLLWNWLKYWNHFYLSAFYADKTLVHKFFADDLQDWSSKSHPDASAHKISEMKEQKLLTCKMEIRKFVFFCSWTIFYSRVPSKPIFPYYIILCCEIFLFYNIQFSRRNPNYLLLHDRNRI